MPDEHKPSSGALRVAAELDQYVRAFQDLSAENAELPPIDALAAIIDAGVRPLVDGLKFTCECGKDEAGIALTAWERDAWQGK